MADPWAPPETAQEAAKPTDAAWAPPEASSSAWEPQEATQERAHQLAAQPGFDPAQYASESGDTEGAFQARQSLKNRTFLQKAGAFLAPFAKFQTWENVGQSGAKFFGGLAAAPAHLLAQGAATAGAPIARSIGANDLADTLENEQQTQGAESTLAGQQVVENLKHLGRGVANLMPSGAGLPVAMAPEEKAKYDEQRDRQMFAAEIEAHRNAAQLAQQRPLESGVVADAAKIATGTPNLSDVYSPEALQSQGARPVSPLMTEMMSSAGDPTNLAEIGAITSPLTKSIMSPLVRGAGAAVTGAANLLSKSHFGSRAGMLGGAYSLFHGNPLGILGVAAPLAEKAAVAGGNNIGSMLSEAGQEMAGAAAPVGQSALRKITKEGIKGAAGGLPVGAAFGATAQSPEEAAQQVATGIGFGGLIGAASGATQAGKSGAIEQSAVAHQLAKEGLAMNFGVGYDDAHNEAMQQLSPEQADLINKYRGFVGRLRTPDGKPIQIYAVTGDKFGDVQKQFGETDAQGNPTNPNGRGMISPDGSQLFINIHAPGDINSPLGHETGHAADLAGQFTNSILSESLKANLAKHLYAQDANGQPDLTQPTPDFQTFIDKYSKAVGPTKAATMDRGAFESEYVAETARKLMEGGNVEKFALPKGMAQGVSDWIADNLGIKPKPGKLGFDSTEIHAITRSVSDLLRDQGTSTPADTSAQFRLDQLQQILSNRPGANATVAELDAYAEAQKEFDSLTKKQATAKGQPFPAAGKPPVAPGQPVAPPTRTANQTKVAAALRLNGIPATEAAQWASVAQGNNVEAMIVDALKKRAQSKFPSTPQPVTIPTGRMFNDHEGNQQTVTGIGQGDTKAGDFVLTPDGQIRRVVRAWPDGKLDVVFPGTADTTTTQPIQPNSFTKLETKPNVQPAPSTPSQPIPAGGTPLPASPNATPQEAVAAGSANPAAVSVGEAPALSVKPSAGGRYVIVDAAGNPINQNTYASEQSANAAIRLQGKTIRLGPGPHGAPDILNLIGDMGGIAPKKATQEYDDMPALHKGFSAILGGAETPEDIAKELHDQHNLGDGSVSTLLSLVQDAMDARKAAQNAPQQPTDTQQAKQSGAEAQAHVDNLVQTAEQRAREQLADAAIRPEGLKLNTKEGRDWKKQQGDKPILTKAEAEQRVNRAKIDAILADIGDDPTGLHKETDPFGNETIVGDFDPSDPRHAALAKIGGLTGKEATAIQDVQAQKGQVTHLRYRGALSGAENAGEGATRQDIETGDINRKQEYALDPAAERTEGTVHHKAIISIGTELKSPSGKILPKAIVLDNLLHNVASIFEGLPLVGRENPYGKTPAEQQPLLVRDAQAYAENHANGYKGDGSGPIQQFPDSNLPKPNPDYTPQEIPADRFAVLNMAFNNDGAGKLSDLLARSKKYQAEGGELPKATQAQLAKAQEAYALGDLNNPWVDHQTGETNQLRADLKAAGFDVKDRLTSVVQNLLPKHILETSSEPIPLREGDIPSVRPSGLDVDPAQLAAKGLPVSKGIGAGFLPSESTDYQGEHGSPDKDSGAPLHAVNANGIYPDDVYSGKALQYYSTGEDKMDREAASLIHQYQGKPNTRIRVFRAVPKSLEKVDINSGDWITPIRQYAKDHGEGALNGDYKIVSKMVHARDIFTNGDSWLEWGYDPQPEDMQARREASVRRNSDLVDRLSNGEKIISINKYPNDQFFGKDAEAIDAYKKNLSDAKIRASSPAFLPTENTPEEEPTAARAGQPPSGSSPQSPASGVTSREDTGKPEDGNTAGERLAREAEQAGVVLSIAVLKGLIQQDPATMERIRTRIQQNTGSPAKFLPREDQTAWMAQQAKQQGFDSLNAFVTQRPEEFKALAVQWRDRAAFMPIEEQADTFGNKTHLEKVDISRIIHDGDENLDAPALKDGDAEPIILERKKSGKLILVDGYHRLVGLKKSGSTIATSIILSAEDAKKLEDNDEGEIQKVQEKMRKGSFLPGEGPTINENDEPWVQRFEQLYQKDQNGKLTPQEDDELDSLHQRIDKEFGSLNAFDRDRKAKGIAIPGISAKERAKARSLSPRP